MSLNELETQPIGKLLARFAIPGTIAMLVNALYNIVDQIFIGRGVGYLGNGAANVVGLLTMLMLAISLLFGEGAAAFFSLRLGEGNQSLAQKGVGIAIFSISCVSLLLAGVSFLALQPILKFLGCTDTLMPLALSYGRIIVAGLPFIMMSTSINSLIRADGSPRYAMGSMIVGALINGCLDPLFIFCFHWGIAGAAVATFIGQFVTFLCSVCYLRKMKSISFHINSVKFHGKTCFQICSLGISSFIDQLSFVLVMAVNNHLIVYFGAMSMFGSDIPLAAYGISMKVQEILFTLLFGLALGMQPIVGYNVGAKNKERVKKTYQLTIAVGTVISLVATILFVFFPQVIVGMFGTQEPLFLEFACQFFRTYFLFYITFGFQTITGIFFQAIGQPGKAATMSLCYQVVFKIGSALLLSYFTGLSGVLWSGPLADTMATLLACYLLSKAWKQLHLQVEKVKRKIL